METDGSSYVLFPYPMKSDPTRTKYSPYCGITGYRLFPRGMSMMADSIGNKDLLAVVVSKDSMNVFSLNEAVNNNRSNGFPAAVNAATKQDAITGVNFTNTSQGTIYFKTQAGQKSSSSGHCGN